MAGLLSIWWVWVAFAIVLGILEILAPAFIFLGFAIGAVATAIVVALFGAQLSAPATLLIFAILSLIAWFGLQRTFKLKKGQVKTFDTDINDG